MSWPSTPLQIVVEIAPGASLTADPSTWSWVDISQYARHAAGVTIARGKSGPLGDTQPSTCTLKLDNAGGRFTPRNPVSPWYGALRRNTPLRVSVLVDGVTTTRWTGHVPRWPPRWSPGLRNEWVEVQALGLSVRLSTSGGVLHGALYRYLALSETETAKAIAYWPLEDASGAKSASSPLDGVSPLWTYGNVSFGSSPPPSGVVSLLDPTGGTLGGTLPASVSPSWAVRCVAVHDTAPAARNRILSWTTPGDVGAWNLVVNGTGTVLEGYTRSVSGSLVVEVSTTVDPTPGTLHVYEADIYTTAGDLHADLWRDGVLIGSDTLASSVTAAPTYIRINPDSDSSDNVPRVGHLSVATSASTTDLYDAATGYTGETAGDRVTAICAEEGVPAYVDSTASAASAPMGPRPVTNLLGVLRDAERTDGGLLLPEQVDGRVGYRPLAELVNRDVDLSVSWTGGQVAPPFEPSEDDDQLVNAVTARRRSGGEARHVDQDSVDAEGLYETSIDVNPEWSAQLGNRAAYEVRKGTVAEARFDSLSVHLASPGGSTLVADWLACDLGARIQVPGVPAELTPDTPDLLLVGYVETLQTPRHWRVDMVCEPYSPYVVAERGSSTLGRRDTAWSSLAVGVDADDTSLSVATSRGPLWVTGSVSIDLAVAGERMTVTAISGASSPQTFTVTRSVNGIAKSHLSSTQVRLWQPARRAL